MTAFKRCLTCTAFLLFVHAKSTSSCSLEFQGRQNQDDPSAQAIMDWLCSQPGAFVSDSIVVDSLSTTTSSAAVARSDGIFARQHISAGQVLMIIPQSAWIDGGDETVNDSYTLCDTTHQLVQEYQKGHDSYYAPYIKYIFHHANNNNTQNDDERSLPSEWTLQGQTLLQSIIGYELPLNDLLLTDESESYSETCQGSSDSFLENKAREIVKHRCWDDVLLPLLDQANHRQGHVRQNVEYVASTHRMNYDIVSDDEKKDSSSSDEEGSFVPYDYQHIKVIALRDIEKGEQLYISYNVCNDEEDRDICDGMSTPDIFWNYGFVEPYPRRWNFELPDGTELFFRLDQHSDKDDNDNLQLTWLPDKPGLAHLNWLRSHHKRLQNMNETISQRAKELPLHHEKDTILEYYSALMTALEQAVYWGSGHYDKESDTERRPKYAMSAANNFSKRYSTQSRVYDTLEDRPDSLDYSMDVCLNQLTPEGYEKIDEVNSQYQNIVFERNNETGDTCLWLSTWLHTCTSFRPHYHEAFVHYAARYVDQVKRVIFFGGGDGMILHEILKYPGLELVIGMELDQEVVRSSHKHLKTQPHFNNEKVQWWFGDAAKSLRMLPEEYFGTFDLVLVDLLTYVTEGLMVTKDLSLMDVAVMLAKPDGVISRNEDFVRGRNTDFAKYTVDIEYHDVPILCQQSITMGSNNIDFLKKTPKDLEVDTVYLKTRGNGHFDGWYNYRTNDEFNRKECHKETGSYEFVTDVERRLGLLTILDLEDAVPFSLEILKTKIRRAMQSASVVEKHVVLSPTTTQNQDKSTLLFILQEGYVTVRTWRNLKYCALDILLWSSHEKQNFLESKIIAEMGSNNGRPISSSYRIVTSGMYGVGIPKEHPTKVGPTKFESCELCSHTLPHIVSTTIGQNHTPGLHELSSAIIVHDVPTTDRQRMFDDLLLDAFTFIQDADPVVAVVCGQESSTCMSLEALSKVNTTVSLVPIWTCSGLAEASDTSAWRMVVCETRTLKILKESLAGKKISGLVLDQGAPRASGRILHKMLRSASARKDLLQEMYVVLALSSYPLDDWRKALMERFRTDLAQFSPAYRADIVLNTTEFELGLFSSGDADFYEHLAGVIETIEKSHGLYSTVRDVKDGITNYLADFEPTKVASLSDYDLDPSLDQWSAPLFSLGQQTIFQFEIRAPKATVRAGENVLVKLDSDPWLETWHLGTVVGKKDDGTYDVTVIANDISPTANIERDSIRKLEAKNDSTSFLIASGERVLIRIGSIWTQGLVRERNDDETYEVHVYDEAGTVTTVGPTDIIRKTETPDRTELPKLSVPLLKKVFQSTIVSIARGVDADSLIAFDDVGNGCLLSAFWPEGNAILQWDGRDSIDVNLFTSAEMSGVQQKLEESFIESIPFLATIARDRQPRGLSRPGDFQSMNELMN